MDDVWLLAGLLHESRWQKERQPKRRSRSVERCVPHHVQILKRTRGRAWVLCGEVRSSHFAAMKACQQDPAETDF